MNYFEMLLQLIGRSKSKQFRVEPVSSNGYDLEVLHRQGFFSDSKLNPLTSVARRYFSQVDEDGIIERILSRLSDRTAKRSVLELGVGNGLENNTLALIFSGFKGYWLGGEDLAFDIDNQNRLVFQKCWVTKRNVVSLVKKIIPRSSLHDVALVSIDLDGNDYYIAQALLQDGLRPDTWVIEYNAKIPLNSKWVMPYDKDHVWSGSDYFGASYSAIIDLFDGYEYFPVACSAQGANIFFVHRKFKKLFMDVSIHPWELYRPPLYFLTPRYGHFSDVHTIESMLKLPWGNKLSEMPPNN